MKKVIAVLLMASMCMATLMGCGANGGGKKEVYVYNWGEYIDPDVLDQFEEETGAIAAELEKYEKMHIACIGENSYDWVTVFLAVLRSKDVFVPIDKELKIDDILNIVNNSDSEVMFCDASFENLFRANIDKMPDIKRFYVFGKKVDDGKFFSYEKFKRECLEGYEGYSAAPHDENELKYLVYTSGTTGMAKGVMLSEHNIVSCVYYGLQVSRVYDCCLSILPYHHTYEAVCGILVSLHKRATICINDSLRNIVKNLKVYKPSYIFVVPMVAEMFHKRILSVMEQNNKLDDFKKGVKISNALRKIGIDKRTKIFAQIHETFGGRLKKIVCGGAPVRPETIKFFDDIGVILINGYGITECSPLVAANREENNDFYSAGKQLPCIEVKMEDVNPDGIGEICVKGDTIMLGYYKNEAATKDALRDGWFYTGDYGRINERGNLAITGRKKNVIVLNNGKNVYPEEVEFLLDSSDLIKESLVYGDKDGNGSVYIRAIVLPDFDELKKKLEDEGKEYNEKNIKDVYMQEITRINEKMPPFKMIKHFTIRKTEFDKTSSKKIKRFSDLNKPGEEDING